MNIWWRAAYVSLIQLFILGGRTDLIAHSPTTFALTMLKWSRLGFLWLRCSKGVPTSGPGLKFFKYMDVLRILPHKTRGNS